MPILQLLAVDYDYDGLLCLNKFCNTLVLFIISNKSVLCFLLNTFSFEHVHNLNFSLTTLVFFVCNHGDY